MRAALIVADAAGSGLPREGHTVSEWLNAAFSNAGEIDAPYIDMKIIAPRIAAIEKETRKSFGWNDFQMAAETLPERAIVGILRQRENARRLCAGSADNSPAVQRPG